MDGWMVWLVIHRNPGQCGMGRYGMVWAAMYVLVIHRKPQRAEAERTVRTVIWERAGRG